MVLFLAGSFALIIGFVRTPSIEYYTGGVVVGLFMLGIFFTYGNSILQTRRLEEQFKKDEQAVASQPSSASTS
jgi:hypothetical protein